MNFDNGVIARASSDSKFLMQALASYCEKQQANHAVVINVLQQAIDSDHRIGSADDSADETVGEFLNRVVGNRLDPNAYLPLSKGYVPLWTVIEGLNKVANHESEYPESGWDLTEFSLLDGHTSPLAQIVVHDGLGDPIEDEERDQFLSYSPAEILQEIQASFSNSVVLCSALKAMDAESITDRITLFRDHLSRYLKDAYNDVTGAIAYYGELISKSIDGAQFLASFNADVDFSLIADESSPSVVGDSPLEYTGASPITSLSIGGIVDQVVSGVKFGVKVVATVFTAAASIIKRGFKWVKEKTVQTFVDPYDIEELETSGSSRTRQIDLFSYVKIDDMAFNNLGSWQIDYGLNELVGHDPIKIDLISGTIIGYDFRIFPNPVDPEGAPQFKMNWMFKPKPLNPEIVKKVLLMDSFSQTEIPCDTIAQRISLLKINPNIYVDTTASEEALARAFMCGYIVTHLLLDLMSGETTRKMQTGYPENPNLFFPRYMLRPCFPSENVDTLPDTITNEVFLRIVSGWNPSTETFEARLPYRADNSAGMSLGVASAFLVIFGWHFYHQHFYPLDFKFFPYLSDGNFGEPTYRIKTDAENIAAAEKFAAIALTVAVAISLVVAAKVSISRFISKITLKHNGIQRMVENKLATGVATPEDLKLFRKSRVKTRLAQMLTGSLAGSPPPVGGLVNSPDSVDLNPIISLIKPL
jgi:hypothetical protein